MPFRAAWAKARAWFVHLLHLDESPHRIAFGAAIGIFIAFTPTVGIQMLLIFIFTSLFRASRVAGVPMAWITNPATLVPIYSFNLYVGVHVAGGSDTTIADFERAVEAIVSKDLTWWDLVKQWWDVVMEVVVPLWVGSVVVGLAGAAVGYAIMYYLIVFYRRQHQRHLAAVAARAAADRDHAPPSDAGDAAQDDGDAPGEARE